MYQYVVFKREILKIMVNAISKKYFPFSSPFSLLTSEDAILKKPFQKEKQDKVAHRQVAMDEWDRYFIKLV